jgi:hypothetical protein
MINDAFNPLHLERVVLALRSLLNTSKLVLTEIGTYDGKNVVMGHTKGNTDVPFILYFNGEYPSIYAGEIGKKNFPVKRYTIEKMQYPPFDFDGTLVRFESCLPETFKLDETMEDIMGFKPTSKFEQKHLNRWKRVEITTQDLLSKVDELKNLWSWTYEIQMDTVSGINVIYCRSDADVKRLKNETDDDDL